MAKKLGIQLTPPVEDSEERRRGKEKMGEEEENMDISSSQPSSITHTETIMDSDEEMERQLQIDEEEEISSPLLTQTSPHVETRAQKRAKSSLSTSTTTSSSSSGQVSNLFTKSKFTQPAFLQSGQSPPPKTRGVKRSRREQMISADMEEEIKGLRVELEKKNKIIEKMKGDILDFKQKLEIKEVELKGLQTHNADLKNWLEFFKNLQKKD